VLKRQEGEEGRLENQTGREEADQMPLIGTVILEEDLGLQFRSEEENLFPTARTLDFTETPWLLVALP
jgi:hypothetical protein